MILVLCFSKRNNSPIKHYDSVVFYSLLTNLLYVLQCKQIVTHMIKKILVLFFTTVATLCISATTALWANAYDGVYILKNMSSDSALLHVGVGCIPLIFAIVGIVQVFKVVGTAHEEEMNEIHKLG